MPNFLKFKMLRGIMWGRAVRGRARTADPRLKALHATQLQQPRPLLL